MVNNKLIFKSYSNSKFMDADGPQPPKLKLKTEEQTNVLKY